MISDVSFSCDLCTEIEISSWASTLNGGPKYMVAAYIRADYLNNGA